MANARTDTKIKCDAINQTVEIDEKQLAEPKESGNVSAIAHRHAQGNAEELDRNAVVSSENEDFSPLLIKHMDSEIRGNR